MKKPVQMRTRSVLILALSLFCIVLTNCANRESLSSASPAATSAASGGNVASVGVTESEVTKACVPPIGAPGILTSQIEPRYAVVNSQSVEEMFESVLDRKSTLRERSYFDDLISTGRLSRADARLTIINSAEAIDHAKALLAAIYCCDPSKVSLDFAFSFGGNWMHGYSSDQMVAAERQLKKYANACSF